MAADGVLDGRRDGKWRGKERISRVNTTTEDSARVRRMSRLTTRDGTAEPDFLETKVSGANRVIENSFQLFFPVQSAHAGQ